MEDALITFLASFLIWIMFLGLFVLWVTDGKIKKEQVLHALLASAAAWILADIIKIIFPTLRPFQVNGGPALTLFTSGDSSFPSGHSAAAFALALTIWLHDKKIGTIYLSAALLVGVARVLGNVHYPVDIIAGAILGSLISLLTEKWHFFKAKLRT